MVKIYSSVFVYLAENDNEDESNFDLPLHYY